MTRIALVASSYLPRFGGVEEHVSHLARELRDRGHDVVIWAVDQGDQVPDDDDGIPIRYLPCPLPSRSFGGLVRFALRAPRAAFAWRRAIRRDRPQILDVQCFGPNGPYAWMFARLARARLVYSNHGETFMDAQNVFEESALLSGALGRTLRDADALTSCSAYAAHDLWSYGAERDVSVVGNGVDLEIGRAAVPSALPARYLAGVGRLVENKGFGMLIRAFDRAAAHDALDGIDLVIAGDGPERRHLEELAAQSGVGGRVHFIGRLARGQVATLLDGALAQVVPSRIEAFGIVILEGWRSATALICTERGGPPEFVTDRVDGLLFDPEDVDELASKLVEVASDEALRRALARSGHERVAAFSWASVADRYEPVFANAAPRDVA